MSSCPLASWLLFFNKKSSFQGYVCPINKISEEQDLEKKELSSVIDRSTARDRELVFASLSVSESDGGGQRSTHDLSSVQPLLYAAVLCVTGADGRRRTWSRFTLKANSQCEDDA